MTEQGKQLALTPDKETALAKTTEVWAALEQVAKESSLAALEGQGRFERMSTLANGIVRMRELLTDEIMAPVMALQGTPLGFRTDKDMQNGYALPQVKEALIEAVLRGVFPVGNEFNIIAARCYITREGMTRLVSEWPGLTDLKTGMGVPATKGDETTVSCGAKWNLHGKPQDLTAIIPIKVNKGMGPDAIIGKATRKLLKRVYDRLTGSRMSIPDGEVEIIDVEPGKALPATGGNKMGFGKNAPLELAADGEPIPPDVGKD